MVRASDSQRKDPSLSPSRPEYSHENSCDIVDFFLYRTSDGRGDEVWVGLGVMSVGGRVPMACSKVVSGPAGVWSNTFGGRNNCLQQSSCGSELPPQKFWFDNPEESSGGSKAESHSVMCNRFPGG